MRNLMTPLALALLLSACEASNTLDTADPAPTPTPDPPAANQSFTTFTKGLLDAEAEAEPVLINDLEFDFDSEDDPAAFDDVLGL